METNFTSISLLREIQTSLQNVQQDYHRLWDAVKDIDSKINHLTSLRQAQDTQPARQADWQRLAVESTAPATHRVSSDAAAAKLLDISGNSLAKSYDSPDGSLVSVPSHRSINTSRIVLTTYPGQSGIDPIQMCWGHDDPISRGPVVVSRSHSTIRRRNGRRMSSKRLCRH